MSHDRLAELQGYRNELAACERRGNTIRAEAVADQIERVTGEIRELITQLGGQADGHEENGQDLLAAQARIEAKRLGRALAAPDGEQVPAAENATPRAPRERAVTKKAGS